MIQGLTGDFVLAFVLLDIAIILIAARLVGNLSVKVGQPRVVGEIVAGVLLGPSLLGATIFQWDNAPKFLHCDVSRSFAPVGANLDTFVARAPSITECLFPLQSRGVLSVIGQIALMLFMFLVGMELNFDSLKGKVRGAITVAVGVTIIPIVIGLGVGALLYNDKFARVGADGSLPDQLAFSLFLGTILAVTAFPVMARVLQEKGLQASTMGVIGVASAALTTILMFIALAVSKGTAKGYTFVEHLSVFAGAILFVLAMVFVVKPLLKPVGERIRRDGDVKPPNFAILMIVVFVASFAADRIGINVIVGGFVAGAIMPERELVFASMKTHISEVTITLLLPIFLAFAGLRTDFTTLGWAWIPGLALFVAAGIVAKWPGGMLSAKLGGLSWAEGNLLGVLMNCRGLLVLVVGLAAADAGLLTPQMQLGGVLMALITTIMTGPLVDKFLPAAVAASNAVAAAGGGALASSTAIGSEMYDVDRPKGSGGGSSKKGRAGKK